jgi:hypothetical protein
MHSCKSDKKIKEKHSAREQGNKRREINKSKSKQKTTLKNAKHTKGSSRRKKKKNLGPKPITSSIKQVVQKDGRKTWKNIKPT